MTRAQLMIDFALEQVGKEYVLGSEGKPPTDLRTWDCSELVQHSIAAGNVDSIRVKNRVTPITAFDGAWFQALRSRRIKVKDAIQTPGALLFVQSARAYPDKPNNIGHVAISLGDGRCVEAKGRKYGVVISRIQPGRFTIATKIDELYREVTDA